MTCAEARTVIRKSSDPRNVDSSQLRLAVGLHIAHCQLCDKWLNKLGEGQPPPTDEELAEIKRLADEDYDAAHR